MPAALTGSPTIILRMPMASVRLMAALVAAFSDSATALPTVTKAWESAPSSKTACPALEDLSVCEPLMKLTSGRALAVPAARFFQCTVLALSA